jgi:hypothetical protein
MQPRHAPAGSNLGRVDPTSPGGYQGSSVMIHDGCFGQGAKRGTTNGIFLGSPRPGRSRDVAHSSIARLLDGILQWLADRILANEPHFSSNPGTAAARSTGEHTGPDRSAGFWPTIGFAKWVPRLTRVFLGAIAKGRFDARCYSPVPGGCRPALPQSSEGTTSGSRSALVR